MNNKASFKSLREQFQSKALEPETLFLLNSDDAIQFLEAGIASGLELGGVEGFRITDQGAYQPRQEFTNVYLNRKGTYEAFIQDTKELMLKGASAGIRFEVFFA